MPLPFILWGAAAALAATGVVKGVQAKNNFDEAKEIGRNAEKRYNNSSSSLDESRISTQKSLEKLGEIKVQAFTNQIKHLVDVIKKGKSKISGFDVEVTTDQLNEYERLVLSSLAIEKGLGTGAVGGALAAMGAYGAVGTLATASTGAAISGLSGAAATNATLAWLGGGALGTGAASFGMAGGMLALGGIVLGPALAIGGFMMASKAEEALTKAEEYSAKVDKAIAEMEIVKTSLKAIRSNAAEISSIILALVKRFDEVKVSDTSNQKAFAQMLEIGKGLKNVLDIGIIEKNGDAVKGIKSRCQGFLELTSR